MKRAVIYARYSCDNQREESIEGQINACTELAEKDGASIIKIYADRAMSGKNDNRPQFQQMLKDAQGGMFDVLYLWKIDRFGRNRYEIIHNKQKLKNAKISIKYVKEHIPETPEGIILESMLEGMAEYYSANLAENVIRGMQTNAEKCYYNGGNIPIGYKVENKYFVLDPFYAPLIKKVFVDYADGVNPLAISQWLNDNGLKSYGRTFVLRIISNKRYTGRYIYKLNGKEFCIENGIPRIVSDELFDKAQERKKRNKTKTNAGGVYASNSFSGKFKCGYCGSTVCLTTTKTYDKKGHYHYYHCSKKCQDKLYAKKQRIDKVVFDFMHKEFLTLENIKAIAKRASELQENPEKDTNHKAQLKAIQKKIDNITQAIENGMFSQSLMDRLKALETEKEEINIKIATAPKKKSLSAKEILDFLLKYTQGDFTDEHFQKSLIDALIYRMELRRNNVDVTFKVADFLFSQSFEF